MYLSHLTKNGQIRMVDISTKKMTRRKAVTTARVLMKPSTLKAITASMVKKGNVLETARIAGIMAAKETHKIIPLCHPINITHIKIDFSTYQPQQIKKLNQLSPAVIEIKTQVQGYDRTGFEMEALVATTIAALTIYDMCKGIDREIEITDIKLVEKSGGRSGTYKRSNTK